MFSVRALSEYSGFFVKEVENENEHEHENKNKSKPMQRKLQGSDCEVLQMNHTDNRETWSGARLQTCQAGWCLPSCKNDEYAKN